MKKFHCSIILFIVISNFHMGCCILSIVFFLVIQQDEIFCVVLRSFPMCVTTQMGRVHLPISPGVPLDRLNKMLKNIGRDIPRTQSQERPIIYKIILDSSRM